MTFLFKSENERLAIAAVDADIYPHLGMNNLSRYYPSKKPVSKRHAGNIEARGPDSGELPLSANELQQFVKSLAEMAGNWSIVWYEGSQYSADVIYKDKFRRVVTFGSVEFTIRPVNNETATGRLFLSPDDVVVCLNAATGVLNANPVQPIAAVIGVGSANNMLIKFEWKIAHVPTARLAGRVLKWRYDVLGSPKEYAAREKEYLMFLKQRGLGDPREGTRAAGNSALKWGKRSSSDVGGSQELSRSRKRSSLGSRSSGTSQAGSAPSSSPPVSLPEMAGQSPAARRGQPPTTLTPIAGITFPNTQPESGWGSDAGSATALVTSGLEDMSIQSQVGVGYWQRGRGNLQQPAGPAPIPRSGYQGPGQMQQTPGYGQLVDVYGHQTYEPQPSRPRGPPRVGFPLSQYMEQGTWVPPQPGQHQVPVVEHTSARDPRRRGHLGVHAQPGSASAGYCGPTTPISSPTTSGLAQYPSSSQLAPSAMPGTVNVSQFQGKSAGPLHLGSYSSNYPPLATATPSTGGNVVDFLVPQSGSPSGRASTSLPYQETSRSAPAGWTDQYGVFHPWQTDRSREN